MIKPQIGFHKEFGIKIKSSKLKLKLPEFEIPISFDCCILDISEDIFSIDFSIKGFQNSENY